MSREDAKPDYKALKASIRCYSFEGRHLRLFWLDADGKQTGIDYSDWLPEAESDPDYAVQYLRKIGYKLFSEHDER